MNVVFTSRYGAHPPSWLRMCHGKCEGMGVYPVHAHHPDDPRMLRLSEPRPLTAYEQAQIDARIATRGREVDGWYFITCPDCGGEGRVSWWTTVTRLPRWVARGVQFCRDNGPSSMAWHGHPASWLRRAWLTVKCAFLCDLGVRV